MSNQRRASSTKVGIIFFCNCFKIMIQISIFFLHSSALSFMHNHNRNLISTIASPSIMCCTLRCCLKWTVNPMPISNPQSPNPQSPNPPIFNPQSLNPQSSILNPQSSILNRSRNCKEDRCDNWIEEGGRGEGGRVGENENVSSIFFGSFFFFFAFASETRVSNHWCTCQLPIWHWFFFFFFS